MYNREVRRIPRDKADLWKVLDEQFSFIEYVFHDFPLETREDALSERYRTRQKFAGAPHRRVRSDHGAMVMIKDRGVSKEYDNREQYYRQGLELLGPVQQGIAARELTPAFIQQWGMLMFCHGYIAAHIFDDTDAFAAQRGEIKSRKTRSRTAQAAWIAKCYEALHGKGNTYEQAFTLVEGFVLKLLEMADPEFEETPYGPFGKKWFRDTLGRQNKGHLSSSYEPGNFDRQKAIAAGNHISLPPTF